MDEKIISLLNCFMVVKQRKPNRLKGFDYSSNGYYFVTICIKDRQEYFGGIVNNKMILNKCGEIINKCWFEIPNHFPLVELDEFQIMPNHIHGIIIVESNILVGNRHACSLRYGMNRRQNQLIPNIINLFKSTTSKLIHRSGTNLFGWQKSYYDIIIRSEISLYFIRQYIKDNPMNWKTDRNNLYPKF